MITNVKNPVVAVASMVALIAAAATFESRPASGAAVKPPDEVRVVNTPLPVSGAVTIGNVVDVNVANAPSVTVGNTPNVMVANTPTVFLANPIEISNLPGSEVKMPWGRTITVPLQVNSGQEVEACHPPLPLNKQIVIETISIHAEAGMSPEDKWFGHFTAVSGGQPVSLHSVLPRVFHNFGPNDTQDLFGGVTEHVSVRPDPGTVLCASIQRTIGFTSGAGFFSISGYQTTIAP